jgi:heterodisulfide reductase subunit A
MKEENQNTDVLVIGAGIAGIEASLMLSKADRNVHLVEKTSYTGGAAIKFEEVFSNMECSTCMLAPIQQELLQDKNINLLTLSEVEEVKGTSGNFTVKIHKKARYVDMVNCIGCNACFEPCPVSLKNEFEEGLGERKAIYVPCAGALPNVPMIDTDNCLRFKGKKCTSCQEACMFEAINYDQKDERIDLKVGAIIAATGFKIFDAKKLPRFG